MDAFMNDVIVLTKKARVLQKKLDIILYDIKMKANNGGGEMSLLNESLTGHRDHIRTYLKGRGFMITECSRYFKISWEHKL